MAESFGKFLSEMFADLGIKPPVAAREMGVDRRTLYNWLKAETPPERGDWDLLVSEYLQIPIRILRRAAIGEMQIPVEYLDRYQWLARREAKKHQQAASPNDGNPLDEIIRLTDSLDEGKRMALVKHLGGKPMKQAAKRRGSDRVDD